MRLRNNLIIYFIILFSISGFSQIEEYNYKRELVNISKQWHKITLPDEIFSKISPNMSDIRIYGVSSKNDTIEVPYIIRQNKEKIINTEVRFKLINSSHKQNGYYFTFEILTLESINQIKLDFQQQNFDWKISLEGSQNQTEWFTIIEDYRILSIKNQFTDYQFTKLVFPTSNYKYFRLQIKTDEKPILKFALINKNEVIDGLTRNYKIFNSNIIENKQSKQTEIDLELEMPVPLAGIKIKVLDEFDFYRPIIIKYLADSFKTDLGWKYSYRELTSGTLTSIEKNEFKFQSTTIKKLKIIINNQDNQALNYGNIEVDGNIYELVARFTEPANYFLIYGKENSRNPNYDISRFTNKIPESLSELALTEEQIIQKSEEESVNPLFQNKLWLWGIMILVIGLLGWFTFKMIGKS